MKKALINGLICGVISLLISFLIARFLLPMPGSVMSNALNNGISAFMGGAISGFMTIITLRPKP